MASRHSRSVETAKMWFIPWSMLCLLWLLFVAKLSWYEAFVGMGAVTAVLGAMMCFAQRHIKRLLAFSTISHMGMMFMGFGLLDRRAFAGMALYLAAHAMVKAALFLCAGMLLHRFGSIDEIELRGHGRMTPWTAGTFLCGGLGLSGLPPWGTFVGGVLMKESAMTLGYGWLHLVDLFAMILTSAAAFRVAGRVFAGWGPAEPEFPKGARKIEEKRETQGSPTRVSPMMYFPALVMSLLGLLMGIWPGLQAAVDANAGRFQNHAGYAAHVLDGTVLPVPAPEPHGMKVGEVAMGIASTLGAISIALATLFRKSLAKKTGKLFFTGLTNWHKRLTSVA